MNRDVGIRGILSPKKSPAEIAEDAKAKAEAMAVIVKKIGPINRHVSAMDPDDFGNIHALEATSKPVKDKFGNTAPQKTGGKLYNDPLLEAAELKKAEMLVSKANAKTVTQLTNLKNWANNSKKVVR